MLSNRPESGKTFQTAMWVVGGIAALQLFGVFWALMKRPGVGVVEARVSSMLPMDLPPMPLNAGVRAGQGAVPGANSVNSNLPPQLSNQSGPTGIVTTPLAANNPAIGNGVIRSGLVPEVGNPAAEIGSAVSSDPLEGPGPGGSGVGSGDRVLAQPSFVGPAGSDRNVLSDSLTRASFSSDEISDPIIERLVSTGVELRSADNMQGALQALKEAEAALPDHPRIMSELAATYRQMGLDEKADGYWERVESLGEIGAGDYYSIARLQLRGEVVPAEGAVEQLMKIGNVIIEEKSSEKPGEKLAARIVIEADPLLRPDGEQLSVLVFFYDQVDGSQIKRSTALTSYLYPTEPYDWQVDGREEIIVNYDQSSLTEEQKRELGERKYFGYVIQLYYRDELQDRVAMPPELEEHHMEDPVNTPTQPDRLEPENALFPESPGL
ncbi:MAG: hypothetical protein P1U87_05150 [Verrucomicrobiales bacterium]|nr:hypothetical protein [Verrucomicrobiales bacterium]